MPFAGVGGGDLRAAGRGPWCTELLGLHHFWSLLGVELLLAVLRV